MTRPDMGVRAAIFLALAVFAAGCASSTATAGADSQESADSVQSDKLLVDTLTTDVAGLDYVSETDSDWDVLTAPANGGAPIDADAVRTAFHRPTLVNSEVRDFEEWFADEMQLPDDGDETEVAYARQMTKAHAAMTANLTDLTVVMLSDGSFEDDSPGELQIFVVGRSTSTGALVALHTVAVWT